MMMPWLILGVVNGFFFRIDTVCVIVNCDISPRELRKINEGGRFLIGNFGG